MSSPSSRNNPSSAAAIAGKYEFEIMSGTASFMAFAYCAGARGPAMARAVENEEPAVPLYWVAVPTLEQVTRLQHVELFAHAHLEQEIQYGCTFAGKQNH